MGDVSRAGFGTKGYCKICAWKYASEFNKLVARHDWNAGEAGRWAKTKGGFTFDRGVYYKHKKEHLTSPRRNWVDEARKKPLRKISTEEYLEAVKDAAVAQIDPDQGGDPAAVTMEQGLKAAQILQASKKPTGNVDVRIVLARLVSGRAPELMAAAIPALPSGDELTDE